MLYIVIITSLLFTVTVIWKQHICPMADEQITQMRYTYTIDCYLAIEKNENPITILTPH